jgi:hypothetical protein
MKTLLATGMVVCALALTTRASVTMTFDTVSPNEVINLNGQQVYAGIYDLTVNGVATPSFCIDVAHSISFGATFTDFNYESLASAPNPPAGPMGETAAAIIEGLWGTYYPAATSSASEAAALQIAVWRAVNEGNYPVTLDFGSDATTQAAYNTATSMLDNISATANLQGLVGSVTDDTQGYVVMNGQGHIVMLPEAPTIIAGALLLLPLGASALRILRKKNRAI